MSTRDGEPEHARVVFPGSGPDEERSIGLWRLRGHGDGPAAYLQAGVHADEIAGMLVLHHLLPMLAAEARAGRLRGDITVVPQANPIGLRQFSHDRLLGRFDATTGQNFNRGFPSAAQGADAGVAAWQAALLRLSADAAIVLDLHTDDEALPYLYVHAELWPDAASLAAALGAAAVLLWRDGGGGAFEDAVLTRWRAAGGLSGRLTATVELRGQSDVDDGLAARDAAGLLALLRQRGVLAGAAGIGQGCGAVVPIEHVQTIRAPAAGVLVFTRPLGAALAAGEPFARLIGQPGDPAADCDLRTSGAGLLLTRTRERYARKGMVVAKLTGDRISASWQAAPLDD